jgi:hypothetical protein
MCRAAGRFAGGENCSLEAAINVGNFPLAALDMLAATVAAAHDSSSNARGKTTSAAAAKFAHRCDFRPLALLIEMSDDVASRCSQPSRRRTAGSGPAHVKIESPEGSEK